MVRFRAGLGLGLGLTVDTQIGTIIGSSVLLGTLLYLKKPTLNYYIIQPKVDKSSKGQMDNSLMRTLLPIS